MIFIENKEYSDPRTSVFGRTLQGRVGPMKTGKKTKKGKTTKNVQIVSGQFKGYCREGWALWTGKKDKNTKRRDCSSCLRSVFERILQRRGHTGRGSCRFLPVSLFTHLGCFYTYHQTYDCKSIFKKSSISL